MDTFLEWMKVVGRRRFCSEHHTVRGEHKGRDNHGSTFDYLHQNQKYGRSHDVLAFLN
jgi:hypothetical protein